MTTTQTHPYTVAALRQWATECREMADWWDEHNDAVAAARNRAHAAAFDALADGIEEAALLTSATGHLMAGDIVASMLGRILSGEKP